MLLLSSSMSLLTGSILVYCGIRQIPSCLCIFKTCWKTHEVTSWIWNFFRHLYIHSFIFWSSTGSQGAGAYGAFTFKKKKHKACVSLKHHPSFLWSNWVSEVRRRGHCVSPKWGRQCEALRGSSGCLCWWHQWLICGFIFSHRKCVGWNCSKEIFRLDSFLLPFWITVFFWDGGSAVPLRELDSWLELEWGWFEILPQMVPRLQ